MGDRRGSQIEVCLRGATKPGEAEVKGLIFDFLWHLKKQVYSEDTIRTYVGSIKCFLSRGADIYNPESVKRIPARERWSNATRLIHISAYTALLGMLGRSWKKPICRTTQKIPFIPKEREIDDLIAGSRRKLSAFLQLLKETAIRSGEAVRLEWKDIDLEMRKIILNCPEKRGEPRIFKASPKLVSILNSLPRVNRRVFGGVLARSMARSLSDTRRRLAKKLNNLRLMRFHFHTLRHWKATMLYHQTKDILYVKQFLGHRRIETTMRYIQLEETLFEENEDEFTVRIASSQEEIKGLLEVGFEFICEKDGRLFFRKRK